MMTEVTTGFAKSHASERRAGLHPCALAIGAITSRIFQVRSLSTMGKSYSVRRESAGFWFVRLNLPESKPPASGLHTSRPSFSDSNNRRLDQFIGPGLTNDAEGLEEPSAVSERHGSEAEFRHQETCIAERFVFHDVLLSPLLRFRSCLAFKGEA